jgi:hypothetical protein
MKTPLFLIAFFCTISLNAQVQMLHSNDTVLTAQVSSVMNSVSYLYQWITLMCIAAVLGWLLFSYCVMKDSYNLKKETNKKKYEF